MEQLSKAIALADTKNYKEAVKVLQELTSQQDNAENVPALILLRSIVLAHPPAEEAQIPSESALLCRIKTLALSKDATDKTSKAVAKLAAKYREKSGCGTFLVGSVYDLFLSDPKKAEMFYAMSVNRWKNDLGLCALGFILITSKVPDEEERKFRELQGVNYFREAAAAGNAMAKANLGMLCLSGVGLEAPDPEQAQALLGESARLGNPMGLNNLVDMHLRRKTLPLDRCKEMLLNEGVMRMGNSRSMVTLGQILESEGDYDGAFGYYASAAKQDHARALYNMGRFTLEGKGSVKKDFREGYRILCLSASMGDPLAKNAIQKLRGDV